MKKIIFLVMVSFLLTACSKDGHKQTDQPSVTAPTTVPTTKTNPYLLAAYVKHLKAFNPEGYVNFDMIARSLEEAEAILNNENTSQEEIDAILNTLREQEEQLNDGSGFPKVSSLPESNELTDPFTFLQGGQVDSRSSWELRADEISKLYRYYMYGVMPDPALEKVTYSVSGNTMNISVTKGNKTITFPVDFHLPNKSKVVMPEGGYPVIMAFGWLAQIPYANDQGYAAITLNTQLIATDDSTRKGVFYDLYPYGNTWTEQTGALMAWSWGMSKIIDALEAGAGTELGISPTNNIVTGVSRWGKAVSVAGAFDKRIRVTAPSCSGAGGMASFRYKTEGKVYDYSSIGASASYKMTANEPLSSLQSSSEAHWFNDNFLLFKDVSALPFDQHLLAALTAEDGRHLFITGSYLYEDWTNPPAMWLTYLAAKEVFDYLGLQDNIAIHIHKEGHMVTDEDMVYLIDYCNHHFYGKKSPSNLEDLKTSLFLEEANYDSIFDKYLN